MLLVTHKTQVILFHRIIVMFNVCRVPGSRNQRAGAHSVVRGCLWSALKILTQQGKSGVRTPELLLICYEFNISISFPPL